MAMRSLETMEDVLGLDNWVKSYGNPYSLDLFVKTLCFNDSHFLNHSSTDFCSTPPCGFIESDFTLLNSSEISEKEKAIICTKLAIMLFIDIDINLLAQRKGLGFINDCLFDIIVYGRYDLYGIESSRLISKLNKKFNLNFMEISIMRGIEESKFIKESFSLKRKALSIMFKRKFV